MRCPFCLVVAVRAKVAACPAVIASHNVALDPRGLELKRLCNLGHQTIAQSMLHSVAERFLMYQLIPPLLVAVVR